MKERLIKSVVVIALLGAAVANASLVAHWEFDEMSGTTVRDSSGNGHHGKVVEGTPIWVSDGKYGRCLDFDETYGVSIPTAVFSDINEAITISVWQYAHTDQNNVRNAILQAGGGEGDDHTFLVTIYVDWRDPELGKVEFCTGYSNDNCEGWGEIKPEDWVGGWNHCVFVVDIIKDFQGIYFNGEPATTGGASTPMAGVTKANIGMGSDRVRRLYMGKLDDIRIYNHALAPGEIAELYTFSPVPQTLADAAAQAETMLKERQPQQVITFLGKKVAELEQCRRKDSNAYALLFSELSFDLNFLLAKAKDAAGLPKEDIDAAWTRAFEQGNPSLSDCASVLLWLYEKEKNGHYENLIRALNEDNRPYLGEVAEMAEKMVVAGQVRRAVEFLESSLFMFAQWREANPFADAPAAHELPGVYFQLAKAKAAAGAAKKELADIYMKTLTAPVRGFVPQRAAGLGWLLENECTDEYTQVVGSMAQRRDATNSVSEIVGGVCHYLESKKDWATFERFLDAWSAQAQHGAGWMPLIESHLTDKTNQWAKRYHEYVDSHPRFKFAQDYVVAQEYLSAGKFEAAAELYGDLVNRCGPADDKGLLKFQHCRCLFDADRNREAAAELQSFIADFETTHPSLVKEAMLMKARAHIQLSEPDKALAAISTLMKKYPEAGSVPEAAFFLGYARMLEGNYEEATRIFSEVIKLHPNDPYAGRARMCLIRIKETRPASKIGKLPQ
ncbi:MAG: LamG-like jellyroll fold domain-containing protein [Planctomycetota bacterium]